MEASLFVKVENGKISFNLRLFGPFKTLYFVIYIGVTSARRDLLVEQFNSDFMKLVEECHDIANAYTKMVLDCPYRILASYFHEKAEKPIRSGRISQRPLSEVIC